MADPALGPVDAVAVEIDMDALLDVKALADRDYGEAIREHLDPMREAIDAYVTAERLNLDDYVNGTQRDAASAAWERLVQCRIALEDARAEAETVRRAGYRAAIDAGVKTAA